MNPYAGKGKEAVLWCGSDDARSVGQPAKLGCAGSVSEGPAVSPTLWPRRWTGGDFEIVIDAFRMIAPKALLVELGP